MLTERQAWIALAESYDTKATSYFQPVGLCARLQVLRQGGRISPATWEKMQERLLAEGRRLGRSDTDTSLSYLWPFGEEGRVARRAFCQRMERAAQRREDFLLALAISLGVIVVRICLRAVGIW